MFGEYYANEKPLTIREFLAVAEGCSVH